MKKVIIIALLATTWSCKKVKDHDDKMDDLEYLEKLYQVRRDILFQEKTKNLDSLINEANRKLDDLKDTEL